MDNKYEDYNVGPKKGGRRYLFRGQKVPDSWEFRHRDSGKTYSSKEELDAALKPAPKKKVAKKKTAVTEE